LTPEVSIAKLEFVRTPPAVAAHGNTAAPLPADCCGVSLYELVLDQFGLQGGYDHVARLLQTDSVQSDFESVRLLVAPIVQVPPHHASPPLTPPPPKARKHLDPAVVANVAAVLRPLVLTKFPSLSDAQLRNEKKVALPPSPR
jgi:hypothetical protein